MEVDDGGRWNIVDNTCNGDTWKYISHNYHAASLLLLSQNIKDPAVMIPAIPLPPAAVSFHRYTLTQAGKIYCEPYKSVFLLIPVISVAEIIH